MPVDMPVKLQQQEQTPLDYDPLGSSLPHPHPQPPHLDPTEQHQQQQHMHIAEEQQQQQQQAHQQLLEQQQLHHQDLQPFGGMYDSSVTLHSDGDLHPHSEGDEQQQQLGQLEPVGGLDSEGPAVLHPDPVDHEIQ